jgi:hypothetical protein
VVNAAQPTILEPTVAQVSASMRTMDAEQSGATGVVPEQHEIFTQQPYG